MNQQELDIKTEEKKPTTVSDFRFAPIKGQPMLHWRGKRPFVSTSYFPAQEKEQHGEEVDGWLNKIFWGDNIQVMSHLLKEYRGQVDLIYIDPPFDSRADYKKRIQLRGVKIENDRLAFEEKQYTDIWVNDEYLQFMYERIMLCKELLSETGSFYVHLDGHVGHYIKLVLDEIFGKDNFVNEIIWQYEGPQSPSDVKFATKHDTIYRYSKNINATKAYELYYKEEEPFDKSKYKQDDKGRYFYTIPKGDYSVESIKRLDGEGRIFWTGTGTPRIKKFIEVSVDGKTMYKTKKIPDVWVITSLGLAAGSKENTGYATQKPEKLLERIVKASSKPGDLVFDCFMGSGTTQAVAMKLGRRFIGADINLGAIQTTTKRLINVAAELNKELPDPAHPKYTGFSVYNVNNYDVFRNPIEAKDLLVQALELDPLPGNTVYDGLDEDWYVKIMPVNRIATRQDLNEIEANFPIKEAEKFKLEHPNKVFQKIRLVCMGHEPALDAELKKMIPYNIEVEILDILREKSDLRFKRDAEAKIRRTKKKLVIEKFYPMNLMEKLSMQKEKVKDWREMVESVMIDFNYDGSVFTPTVTDIPEKDEFVKGEYDIPEDAGTIRVKITDLLSESLEQEVS